VDAHGIQAFYTGLVARASNMDVRIDATADGVAIAATPAVAPRLPIEKTENLS
jgi:histidine phosphotransferase ChpT